MSGSKKLFVLIMSAVLVFALILSAALTYHFTKIDDDTIIGSINGINVYAGELRDQMSRDKVYVTDYYEQEKGAEINKDFWSTEQDGQKPMDYLRNYSLESVAKYKIVQQLAVQYDLLKDTSYTAFLKALDDENSSRAEKISGGEVVYGQEEYNKDTYYEYILSNYKIDLRTLMSKEGEPLCPTEDQLKDYYYDVREYSFKKISDYKFDVFTIQYEDPYKQNGSKYTQEQAEPIIKEVKKLAEKGGNYREAIASAYPDVQRLDLVIDNDAYSGVYKSDPKFYEMITKLKAGDISDVADYDFHLKFAVCTYAKEAGYESFEDIKDKVKNQYEGWALDKHIDELYSKCEFVANGKFDKVKFR